jgi:hypothetical protein
MNLTGVGAVEFLSILGADPVSVQIVIPLSIAALNVDDVVRPLSLKEPNGRG